MITGRTIEPIAQIQTDFTSKFGIPRQSGLVPQLIGKIMFQPSYRRPEMLLGLEEYSHLWLLWGFSANEASQWSPIVYPPRLGGKTKRGVFATRSPFRPNGLGLSCVKLEKVVQESEEGPLLYVSGVDLLDQTPIYDIKPYLPYADAYPDAKGGFGQEHSKDKIKVVFPKELLEKLPKDKRQAAVCVLQQDPRAAYQKKEAYVYGMAFAGMDIRFTVQEHTIYVRDVVKIKQESWKKVK